MRTKKGQGAGMFRKLLYSAFSVLGAREVEAFQRAAQSPREHQTQLLLQILNRNANTEYGRTHSFAAIKSVSDYQRSVPINEYDSLLQHIDEIAGGKENVLTGEQPFMFATTSGTTAARKLIPVTRSYVKEFRRASVVSGYHLLRSYPGVVQGVTLSIFSSAQESLTSAGIPCGAISGRLYLEEPALIKRFISPLPYDVLIIKDYESRYYTLLRCALVLPISVIYTLNPSTVVLLARKLKTYAPQLIQDVAEGRLTPPGDLSSKERSSVASFLPADLERARQLQRLLDRDEFLPPRIWPQLSLISCWTKAAAAFYIKDFPQWYPGVPVCDITYGASEGRGTVCLGPDKQALAVRSHFFEFVPEEEMKKGNPRALMADELELGQQYYILFTTSAGLYRYNINDIVRVAGWHGKTPLLEFMHKSGNISSFTGEKVTESQITTAVSATIAETGLDLRFFTVIPEFRPEPHYQLWLEPSKTVSQSAVETLGVVFDRELGRSNVEYATKRESQRLAAAVARTLASGTYDELRAELVREGVPDAQVKISHLSPKERIKARLESRLLTPVS